MDQFMNPIFTTYLFFFSKPERFFLLDVFLKASTTTDKHQHTQESIRHHK